VAAVHKTHLRERFATNAAVRPGEAVVAGGVQHPERGYVRSPAATLMADRLEGRGLRVQRAEVTAGVSGAEPGPQELDLVSYIGWDGVAVGIGVVASAQDAAARRAVDEELSAWSDAMRSRRVIMAAIVPWCGGTSRALAIAQRRAALQPGPVYVVGRLTENPTVAQQLLAQGLIGVEDLDAVPDGATVLFAQHGVPLAVEAEAAARELTVVDATCPLAASTRAEVRRLTGRGDTVVLVGREGDAALPGLASQAPEAVRVVGDVQDVSALHVTDPQRIAVVLQPGLSGKTTGPVLRALGARFGRVAPQHPSTLCDAADDRRAQIRSLAESCDTVLIAGAEDDPESARISAVCLTSGAAAHCVARLARLEPAWIARSVTVGVTATMCADPVLPGRLITALRGLGPVSVVERRVVTQSVSTPSGVAETVLETTSW
jgi:4-hydroxy-3-methylbut-2-enyl diphosphate reductase